ncbi:hypothetical protein CHS0354_004805, partial [Potamilus streckersoni]
WECGECHNFRFVRSVLRRHLIEQHSGFGWKCKGCKKIFGRHQNFIFLDGNQVVMVNMLTGVTGVDQKVKWYHRRWQGQRGYGATAITEDDESDGELSLLVGPMETLDKLFTGDLALVAMPMEYLVKAYALGLTKSVARQLKICQQ